MSVRSNSANRASQSAVWRGNVSNLLSEVLCHRRVMHSPQKSRLATEETRAVTYFDRENVSYLKTVLDRVWATRATKQAGENKPVRIG
jgi:hypothetical protein